MNETSRLSIVVDTTGAKAKLVEFTRQLKEATDAGTKLGSTAGQVGSGLNSQADAAHKAKIQQDQLAISGAKVVAQNNRTASSIQGLVASENRAIISATNRQAAEVKLVTAGKQQEMQNNRTASSAAQLVVNNQKIAITAQQLATAQFKAVTASNQAAASNNRLSVSANQVTVSNNRVTTSAAQASAALTRDQIATVNLARANWTLVTAATGSSTAQQRLAAATSQAVAAQARAETATLRLAAAQARAEAAANGHTGAMARASGASRTLYQNMNKLYTLMNSGLVIYGGLGFVKVAADMQNLNNQIKLVTDSEYEYLGMKREVMKVANENYSDISSTISLYQKSVRALTNLGKSQADALKFTEAVSLAMRTGGRSAGEQAAAILQLGQAMGAGVIMGDEFRSISENAPVLLDLVAKKMGVLQGDLKALAADGKITAEIMYDALTENMDALEDLATKMPLTMGQAFVVAKNRFKEYTDDMMNKTGGVSDKISGMLMGISDNFDTIAKVGMAAMTIGLLGIIANLATATKAMAAFNFVANMNPLVLLASGFLAVNSAIFGTNDVITISGFLLSDFFDGMGAMLKDGETWWMDFSDTVATAMGITVKEVASANDKNSKNFLGFYENTEKGFAGVVQGLGTAVGSVTAIFGTFFEMLGRWTDNMFTTFENMGKAAYNAGVNVRNFFGGDGETVEYGGFKSLDAIGVYKDTFSANQDYWRDKAVGLNQRAGITETPLDKQWSNKTTRGFDFKNALVVGNNTVLAKKIGSLPDYLIPTGSNFRANTAPRSEEAKIAYENRKLVQAEEERLEGLKKLRKEQEKQNKAANKGRSNRLIGISGDTGIGSAHLHVQLRDKSRALNADELARFQVGGKSVTDYKMTSGYGKRNTGIKGASTNHKGVDYGVPKNTPITTNSPVSSVRTWFDKNGGGYVSSVDFEDGLKVDFLHQMPSVTNVEKGSSTGNKQIDSLMSKAAKEAQREQLAQAKEAEKRLAEQLRTQEELVKRYASERIVIDRELDEELTKIQGSGFDDATIKKMSDQAKAEAEIKYNTYVEGLNRQLDALDDSQKTERQLIQQTTDYAKFDAINNKELIREGNEEMLEYTLKAIDREHERKIALMEERLNAEYNNLMEFSLTDREKYEKDWIAKMATANNATDELKDYRIEMYKQEKALQDKLFDLSEDEKRLELQQTHMTSMQYMLAEYNLKKRTIELSNDTPDNKRIRTNAAGQAIGDEVTTMMEGFAGEKNPFSALDEQHEENLERIRNYEISRGLIEGQAQTERLAAEKAYMEAKRDLIINSGEEVFGSIASIAKDSLGEQSAIYRTMFAMEKGFAIARSVMAIQTAMASATASMPFPYNLPAVAQIAAQGASIMSNIRAVIPEGFQKGGYTGNGGVSDIAGVVHGQEYVFDAKSTRDIGIDNLNALRSGKGMGGETKVIIHNYSNEKAQVQKTPDGDTMVIIGKVVNQMVDSKISKWEQKAKRQGGSLYGS